MKNWLTELISDLKFLGRKTRRSARVLVKNISKDSRNFQLNGIASRNGSPANFADPLTSETLLNGEPAHYIGQNQARIDAHNDSMGIGRFHQG